MSGTRNRAGETVRKERSPKSFWFDPRLAIGVGLVIASVVGVFAVVAASDRSVQVYSAATTLHPGDLVYPRDLNVASVQLGQAAGNYLREADVPVDGLLVTRAVLAGELIPASAVGSASSVRVASVVVRVGGELSHSITPGAVVDVWSAAVTDDRRFGPPSVLVGSATVVRVLESKGLIADGRGQVVELLVPRERIARVLEAVTDSASISLVPTSIQLSR